MSATVLLPSCPTITLIVEVPAVKAETSNINALLSAAAVTAPVVEEVAVEAVVVSTLSVATVASCVDGAVSENIWKLDPNPDNALCPATAVEEEDDDEDEED